MNPDLAKIDYHLSQTPRILTSILENLPKDLQDSNEGKDTWSPHEILRHLIYCEETDWLPRAKIILSDAKEFEPFDRFAHLHQDENKSLADLLKKFTRLREDNLRELMKLDLSSTHLAKTGIHPEFGEVTMRELLFSWVAHDLSHISQICRVLAKQYKADAGPWARYMSILNQ